MKYIFLLIAVILVSCSKKSYEVEYKDDIKFVKSIKVENSDLSLNMNRLKKIDGDKFDVVNPIALDFSKNGDIFILDNFNSTIKKFDKDGNHLKTFGRKGSGPGEFNYAFNFFVDKDTIFVIDQPRKELVKFGSDGSFYTKTFLEKLPYHIKKLSNGDFIGFIQSFKNIDGSTIMNYDLAVLNRSLEVKKVIKEKKIKLTQELNILDVIPPFTVSSNKIYLSENSDDSYKIDVFTYDGTKKMVIEKPYRKIKLSEKELKNYLSVQKLENRGLENPYITKLHAIYKKAINKMFIDKSGNLVVVPSVERDEKNNGVWFADIFSDGIWQNRTELKSIPSHCNDFLDNTSQIYFKNDMIYFSGLDSSSIYMFEY